VGNQQLTTCTIAGPFHHACRLWHQLTEALLAFVKDKRASRGRNLIEVRGRRRR
jgi:hypothetical protein